MTSRPARSPRTNKRRRWPTPSIVIAGAALFVALGGSAVAANSLIRSADIAPGAVTSAAIKNGGVEPGDLSPRTRALVAGAPGLAGPRGDAGTPGTNGNPGTNGINGPNGPNGANGVDGSDGEDGVDGTDGLNGTDGEDGTNGTDGDPGSDGADGTIVPLSATNPLTPLPPTTPPTTVVELQAPAGSYVILAKTQLTHTGAGDSIDCTLKAGATILDQVAMKTMPALAAMPVSMQAVTTIPAASKLSVECDVLTAGGTASSSSLIALPTA